MHDPSCYPTAFAQLGLGPLDVPQHANWGSVATAVRPRAATSAGVKSDEDVHPSGDMWPSSVTSADLAKAMEHLQSVTGG